MKSLIAIMSISVLILLRACAAPTAISYVAAQPKPTTAPVSTVTPTAAAALAEETTVRQVQEVSGIQFARATTDRGVIYAGQDADVRLWVFARDGQVLGAHLIAGLSPDRKNAQRIQTVARSVTSTLNPPVVPWIAANLKLPEPGQTADYTVCEVGAAPDCDLDHSRVTAFNEGASGANTFVVDIVAQGAPPYVP